jgi:hypothetical protein
MRLNFKHIVVIGLVLAAAETWMKISQSKETETDEIAMTDQPVKVYARESQTTVSKAITAIPVTNWTVQVGAVLATGGSTTNQAINLLAMFPNLPPEAQLEAAQHVSRLLPDDYFGALGTQLTNTAASPAVRRVIFVDLVTRPNRLKLPWLVEVAQSSLEDQSGEALLLLRSALREDYGSNWTLWRERVAVWLTMHPDQMPPANPGMAVSN